MKVLLIIDHAPDYREDFFYELGKQVDLTVVAQPCEDGLRSPNVRSGYVYIEIPAKRYMGFYWQPGLDQLLHNEEWDILCIDLNMRHLERLFLFLKNPKYWSRWVWWGHIFGLNSSRVLDYLRRFLLTHSGGCLAYNEGIVGHLRTRYGIKALSINNSQIRENDFRVGCFSSHPEIRMLFVGRYQYRKRLERFVDLALRRTDIHVRLVGPGMEELKVPDALLSTGRFELFSQTVGTNLNQHFDWADLVANPGHVGLLVSNTAMHGKGIVIDRDSKHAPEYWLALETKQPFISFGDPNAVDTFIEGIKQCPDQVQVWGNLLQSIAREKHTIEHMVKIHLELFKKIYNDTKHKIGD